MTILTMPRCPGAGRGGAGGAAVLLLDVLHPQDTLRVQGGVLRSGIAKYIREIYTRDVDQILFFYSLFPILLHSRRRPGRECELYRVQHVLPVGATLPHLHGLRVLPAAHVLAQHGGRPHEVPLQGDYNKVQKIISNLSLSRADI